MRNKYSITFSFTAQKPLDYFEMVDDFDSLFYTQTATRVVESENEHKATTKLRHKWSTPITILDIKKLDNTHEREERTL